MTRPALRWLAVSAGVAVLAALPLLDLPTGGILPGSLASPGSLQLLGVCLCFGALAGVYFGSIGPDLGASLLIFAFITVVIGGLGSVTGSAVAALAVGLLQQFANYYTALGVGDLAVVLLLAAVLLVRPAGLAPKVAH